MSEEKELILAQDKAQDKAQDEIVNEKISNMNEEENQAFKILHFYNSEDYGTEELKKYIKIIVNLVEKQQKEIENYQILKDDIEGHRIVYVDTPEFEENYISKDKIKDKIEKKMRGEINKSWRNTEQRKCQLYAYDILKELLEG